MCEGCRCPLDCKTVTLRAKILQNVSFHTYFDKISCLIKFCMYIKMFCIFGSERREMMPVIKEDLEEKQIYHFVIVFVVVRL